MKINRNSWHYRLRAWALREDELAFLIESRYGVSLGTYIADILVFGILATPFRLIGKAISRLTRAYRKIEFYNDKEER